MSASAQFGFSGPEKDLFRIGEVSRITGTKQFVLRYWETEFPMLRPVKSPKGHRLYRREDVDTVLRIKRLLYDEGFTIAGARRHLADQPAVEASEQDFAVSAPPMPIVDRPDAGQPTAGQPGAADPDSYVAEGSLQPPVPPLAFSEEHVVVERQKLLDLRDSLRSFLTLLENE